MESGGFKKLIFIYNADSGIRNMIMDSAHKIVSPSTYECSLCDITFGVFAENSVWKKFRKGTHLEMEFLHKDEFRKTYKSKFGHKFSYPIVLAETSRGLEIMIKTDELNNLERVEDLILMLGDRTG